MGLESDLMGLNWGYNGIAMGFYYFRIALYGDNKI